MATWADRRDAYNADMRGVARQEEARRRLEEERNALADILRSAYEPGMTATPDRAYTDADVGSGVGPMSMGSPIPGTGSPATSGRLNMQNAIARMSQSRFAPEALKLQEQYDQNSLRGRLLSKKPSDIEVYEYWKNLKTPEDQANFERTMRQTFDVQKIGEVPTLIQKIPGAPSMPLSTLDREVGGKAAIEAGKEAAQITAKTRTEAGLSVPGAEMVAETTERYIDELKGHPGKKYSLGAYSAVPTKLTPGTSRVDFKARLDQLKGGAFLEARQLLKGGGQITDFEGKRAEAAMARMDTAQSEDAFDSALEDFRIAVRDGAAKLKQKATGGAIPPAGYKIPKGARTGTDEQGRKVFSTDGGQTVFDATTGKRIK